MPQKALDEIHENILRYIHDYYKENEFYQSITIRDIASAMGYVSREKKPYTSSISSRLSFLEKNGYVRRASGKHNAIKLTDKGEREVEKLLETESLGNDGTVVQTEIQRGILPYIGIIAAGSPRGSFPEKREVDVLEGLEGDGVYVMRVRGDSMIEAHICDGDYVVLKRKGDKKNYKTEDIVAAYGDDEGIDDATLKRYYDEGHQVRLQPANSKMKPIVVPKEIWEKRWSIQGKVIGIIRKYKDI